MVIGGERDSLELWLADGPTDDCSSPIQAGTTTATALLRSRRDPHEVVLVNVADGTETSVQLVAEDGTPWWPRQLTRSPDGRMLVGNARPEGAPPACSSFPPTGPAM